MLNFLTSNNIADMEGLNVHFKSMIHKQLDIRDKLKPIDRRIKTIDEHIRQSGTYKTYRGQKAQYEKLYAQYKAIKNATGFIAKRKAQKALDAANEYYETYRSEITMCKNAEQYLKDVLQGHFDPKKLPPVTKWTAERDKLAAERSKLNQQYGALKNEVSEAEQIRKGVYDIVRAEQRQAEPQRTRGMDR